MAEDVTVHVRTALYPLGSPVEGVYVAIHDNLGGFITSGITADGTGPVAAGEVVFPAIVGGTYEVRINPNVPGSVVNGAVQRIEVEDPVVPPNTNTFDFAVNISELPPATDTRLCRASGYFVDTAGRPAANVSLHFSESRLSQLLYSAPNEGTQGVIPKKVIAVTDKNGYAVIDLIRCTEYSVYMEGYEDTHRLISVPDAEAVNLPDLIFPYIEIVEYTLDGSPVLPVTSPAITIPVGDKEVETTVRLRTTVETERNLVDYESSDESVVTVRTIAEGILLTGLSAGTATIQVSRRETGPEEQRILITPIPVLRGDLAVTVA